MTIEMGFFLKPCVVLHDLGGFPSITLERIDGGWAPPSWWLEKSASDAIALSSDDDPRTDDEIRMDATHAAFEAVAGVEVEVEHEWIVFSRKHYNYGEF